MTVHHYQVYCDMDDDEPSLVEPELSDNFYKIVVVGDYGVGKSSIISRFCDDFFPESHATTIGIDFKVKTVTLDRQKIKLEIFDTAGLEKFRPIASAYYQNASGVLIVYDVTDAESFQNISKYFRDVKFFIPPDAEMLLVGNKCDLMNERKISFAQAETFASQFGLSLFEVSAKSGHNVEQLFSELMLRIRERTETAPFGEPPLIILDSSEKQPNAWCSFCACG